MDRGIDIRQEMDKLVVRRGDGTGDGDVISDLELTITVDDWFSFCVTHDFFREMTAVYLREEASILYTYIDLYNS